MFVVVVFMVEAVVVGGPLGGRVPVEVSRGSTEVPVVGFRV